MNDIICYSFLHRHPVSASAKMVSRTITECAPVQQQRFRCITHWMCVNECINESVGKCSSEKTGGAFWWLVITSVLQAEETGDWLRKIRDKKKNSSEFFWGNVNKTWKMTKQRAWRERGNPRWFKFQDRQIVSVKSGGKKVELIKLHALRRRLTYKGFYISFRDSW